MQFIWFIALVALLTFAVRFVVKSNEESLKQLIGVYIAWAFINLVVLVTSFKYETLFFPFENISIDQYDYPEFLVYVFTPVVIIYVRRWMKK